MNTRLNFSLYKRCEYHLWGPHSSTHNRTKPAVKSVEYCRLWQRIIKERSFWNKNHDSLHPASWISTSWGFPRTWNAWIWSWHIVWRPRNKSPSNQLPNTQHQPWLYSFKNLETHNNNNIALTFMCSNTLLSALVLQICSFRKCKFQQVQCYRYRKY